MRWLKPWMAWIGLIGVVLVLQVINQQKVYEAGVAGCERTNAGLRGPLYDFFTDAITARQAEARQARSVHDRRINLQAANNYIQGRKQMLAATSEHPVPDQPWLSDCPEVYPKPTLLGITH